VSAVTGGTVLRAAARVFVGAGAPPKEHHGPETTGTGEEPEVRDPTRAIPSPMLVVPALLLCGCLAVGVVPSVGRACARAAVLFTDRAGYAAAVAGRIPTPLGPAPPAGWSTAGVLLGLFSVALAAAFAAAALWGPAVPWRRARRIRDAVLRTAWRVIVPLRRLHSGHAGDYASWLAVGIAVLLAVVAART
jgi:multicomponent Na+:H+ antiporter subunit D